MLSTLLSLLEDYLPTIAPPLPAPSVSVVSVTERSVGLGNRVGDELRGSFAVTALKGSRLDAVVRFQVWADELTDVDRAIANLHERLIADKLILRALGFLKLVVKETSLGEFIPTLNAWRKTVDCNVLYEFQFQDTDGAQSLIARIPINTGSPFSELTTVTDHMARWDDRSAPKLVLRGRFTLKRLSILAFIADRSPTGDIVISRTFDGAVGIPTSFPTLAAFRTAIAGPNPASRHAQVRFRSLERFLDECDAAGDPIDLGDWDLDGVPDSYESKALSFEPALQLATVGDRLEIVHQGRAFDRAAVAYLRAS